MTLIGHCRHCYAPIIHPGGATCTHRGFLMWTTTTRFWQGGSGNYEYQAMMRQGFPANYPPEPTNHQAADTADLIADMLAHPL